MEYHYNGVANATVCARTRARVRTRVLVPAPSEHGYCKYATPVLV